MKYTQLIKEIRQFQLVGFGAFPGSDEDINMIMRRGKAIFVNPIGNDLLVKILNLIRNELKIKTQISTKQLEKYFVDDFFYLFLDSKKSDAEIIKKLNTFLSKIKILLEKKFTIAIPISGLVVKKDFQILNYKIITKNKFRKLYKNVFSHPDLKKEYANINERGDSIAIIDDFGDLATLREKHLLEVDQALDLVRLYIPQFWHHIYEVQLSVTNKRIFQDNTCYTFEKGKLVNINRAVESRQHAFEIDVKRMPKDKYTIRASIGKLNIEKLNSIILKNNAISTRITTSLRWIGLYSKQKDKNLKFLFLIFSLEGIFANEQNNYSSITASISEKVSFLINKTGENRIKTFELLKKLYIKRSSIIHGSKDVVSDKDLFNLYHIILNVYYGLSNVIIKHRIETINALNDYLINLKFKNINHKLSAKL